MKIIVIFYSFEGNTRLIAQTIAQELGADTLELRLRKKTAPKGFMKYFWGGRQVMMKTKPALAPFNKNIDDYDLLFIGTPVWAWSYAPALNTFFSTVTIRNKKVAFFCCHGGGKGNIFAKMKNALGKNTYRDEIDFCEPLKRDTKTHIQRACAWARAARDAV